MESERFDGLLPRGILLNKFSYLSRELNYVKTGRTRFWKKILPSSQVARHGRHRIRHHLCVPDRRLRGVLRLLHDLLHILSITAGLSAVCVFSLHDDPGL